MRKRPPSCSPKNKSAMLLDQLFGVDAAQSLASFHSKSSAEKTLAVQKSRVKILEKKLMVAKRTSLAVSKVRMKQLAAANMESITLAGKVTEVSAHRDMVLTENAELRVELERRALDPYDQKRLDQSSAETHALLVGCVEAFLEVDPGGAKRFLRSQGNSATRVLATSITKVYSQKALPGGKSKFGRASTSSW